MTPRILKIAELTDRQGDIDNEIKSLLTKQNDLEKEDVKRVKLILLILWFEAMRDIDEESAKRINNISHPFLRE